MRYHYNYKLGGSIKHIKTKIAGILTITMVAASGLLMSSNAFAYSQTLYVGHSTTGNDHSCKSAGYNSVQAAVNAANNGDTVFLCGAQFSEQVFIDKSITLTGDNGSGLSAIGTTFSTDQTKYPSQFASDGLFTPQALVVITGAASTHVSINNLDISGPMPTNGGCANDDYGILALGGNVDLNNDQVLNVADSNSALYGCQYGVGIEVGAGTWETTNFSSYPTVDFAAKANIDGVTVSGYQKNGITVDGTGSSANITNSTIVGGGSGAPFGTIIGQNGIQISDGATGSIKNNKVKDNAYSGDGYASATGILIFGGYGSPLSTGVEISGNTLKNNDVGVYLANYTSDGSGPATTRTNENVHNNYIYNAAVTNVSGLCGGFATPPETLAEALAACGGEYIGYQAGVSDTGNHDSIFNNQIAGKGYAKQGKYTFNTTPPVFTQTGPNPAFVRPIDAGESFPTTDSQVYGNSYSHNAYNEYFNYQGNFNRKHHNQFNYWH